MEKKQSLCAGDNENSELQEPRFEGISCNLVCYIKCQRVSSETSPK